MINIHIFFFLIIINYSISYQCIEGENFCLKCNSESNLCIQCKNEVLIPDSQGGCEGINKCKLGENYCNECNIENTLCNTCEIGFFPDDNGGCSFNDNCQISYKGLCLKCQQDYILIGPGEDYKFCKSIYSSDLKNCKTINEEKGICTECEDGYFLGKGDYTCTKIEHCYESSFGTCNKCEDDYYLDRKNEACLLKENKFKNCKESLNGENCEICDDNYFLSEDLYCINTNFCGETKDDKCIKCLDSYSLTVNGKCSSTENCLNSDAETGICQECLKEFYFDLKDEKCKSNEIEEKNKFCSKFKDVCIDCINGYFIGEDNRCSTTKNCAESKSGICSVCSNNYILIKDNKCIDIENCSEINDKYECIECKDDYLLVNKTCILIEDDKFENCKKADDNGKICVLCHNDFYLNKTNNLCFSNKEYGQFYKCKTSSDNSEGSNICIECVPEYYLGYEDRKCTHTIGCITSNNKNECHNCDSDYFCLNLLNNTCIQNEYIPNEERMMYYKCILTNENGTKCETCKYLFEIREEGYCYNIRDCYDIEDDDTCSKCRKQSFYGFPTCLNKYYGCVETSVNNCLRCDNPLEFEICTECLEGYELSENGSCEKIS